MNSNAHRSYQAERVHRIVTAPLRFTGNVLFCAFVVVAAYAMLLFCEILTFLDNVIFAPLARWMTQPAK